MKNGLGTATALIMLVAIGGGSILGCASDGRHDSTRPNSEVRRDSDRFFDKMKEEERTRGDGAERRP